MIPKRLFILVYSLLSLQALFSQSLSETYEMAQQFQQQQQYEAAISAYQRVIFFDKKQTYQAEAYLQLGHCSEAIGRYQQADRFLNFAYYLQSDPEIQRSIQFQQIRLRLLQQDFVGAQEELWVLGSLPSGERPNYHLYSFVAAFGQERYDSARFHLDFFVGENDSLALVVDELFTQNEKVSRISARKAKILSIILPGLGQFYAGDVKAGINSLGLSAGLLVVAWQVAIRSTPLDAAFAIVPWFVRYYQGGYERAAKMALRKQDRRRAEIYQALLNVVESP